MRDPLNRENAQRIVRFFDVCFKQGVLDAAAFGDTYQTQEFIDKHKASFTFGVLGDDRIFDWQMFRFTLYWWARNAGLTGLAENYLLFVRKKNYLWCLLPYCMQFYLLGIDEWLEYPSPGPLELFKSNKKIHWSPQSKVKKFSLADYVSYLHEFAYAYRSVPEDGQLVSPNTMDSFCLAMYDLTRQYVARREGYKEEEYL